MAANRKAIEVYLLIMSQMVPDIIASDAHKVLRHEVHCGTFAEKQSSAYQVRIAAYEYKTFGYCGHIVLQLRLQKYRSNHGLLQLQIGSNANIRTAF